MKLTEKIHQTLIDVPDFPKPGILFKDITPIFRDPNLSKEIVHASASQLKEMGVDVIVGLESRGFPLGLAIAVELEIPFVMIRKKGKLPRPAFQVSYDLEYGQATMELQKGDIQPEQKVYIHDDLLATGGTAHAAGQLVQMAGGKVVGFGFIITLDTLKGKEKLEVFGAPVHTFAAI
jgi:adenine phosphoribosyltransferase